jgi:hypothetical protein
MMSERRKAATKFERLEEELVKENQEFIEKEQQKQEVYVTFHIHTDQRECLIVCDSVYLYHSEMLYFVCLFVVSLCHTANL